MILGTFPAQLNSSRHLLTCINGVSFRGLASEPKFFRHQNCRLKGHHEQSESCCDSFVCHLDELKFCVIFDSLCVHIIPHSRRLGSTVIVSTAFFVRSVRVAKTMILDTYLGSFVRIAAIELNFAELNLHQSFERLLRAFVTKHSVSQFKQFIFEAALSLALSCHSNPSEIWAYWPIADPRISQLINKKRTFHTFTYATRLTDNYVATA